MTPDLITHIEQTSKATVSQQQTFFNGQAQGPETGLEQTVAEAPAAAAPLLTDAQVTSARAFMRNNYAPESIELLRSRFGLSDGRQVDRELVLAVAQYQDTNNVTVDGKLGETTFNTIQAEGGEVMQDVIMFSVMSPVSGRMVVNGGPGITSFSGQFNIEIHFPPGEDSSKYEYRQFICGRVEMLPAGADPAGPMTDLCSLFSVPGGLQPIPNYTQDGNTGLTPQQMGHRSGPGSTSPLNHYVNADGSENQRNGCIFRGEDFPAITGRITNTGDQYEFDFRFMGLIVHKDRGVIARKFWSVQEDFLI